MSEWKRNKRRTNGFPAGLKGKLVEARHRDGEIFTGVVGEHTYLNSRSFNTSDVCDGDVMAYRILEQIEPSAPDYTSGYPEGTTAADIGAKIGDEFVVVRDLSVHGFRAGTIVRYKEGSKNAAHLQIFSDGITSRAIAFWELSPVPPKSSIELQEEEVGIPEPVKKWPEDRVDVVGQNGNDGLHYDDIHLGIKRPDGEGFVKYNAGDIVNLDGVVSVDYATAEGREATCHIPVALNFQDGNKNQIVWYRLNYTEQIDTSPERVEIEKENVRIPSEEHVEQLQDHEDSALKAFERGLQPTTAPDFLQSALQTLTQRGKDYDKPEGERSAAAVAVAFNAITGKHLTDAEVWLVLQLVKDVRQWQNPGRYHADSALDCVAYAALKAEALAKGGECC